MVSHEKIHASYMIKETMNEKEVTGKWECLEGGNEGGK